MKAKKSLGQHFLKSEKAIREIVAAGDIHNGEVVLEIGPGQGVLTDALLKAGARVVAIEKDRELIPLLEDRFLKEIDSGALQLIEADILKFDPCVLNVKEYKLIANIPYYITGAIIEQFLSTTHQPSTLVLLMQKEVAERIIARDKKESVLSIAIRAYGTAHIVAKVPAGAFTPAPTVDSAILSINDVSRDFFTDVDERTFFKVVKALFGKKRKQLAGSLGEYLNDKARALYIVQKLAIDPKTRPEDLSLVQWKHLAQEVAQ